MYTLYHVQTFYGTHQKTFQSLYHAERYMSQLAREIDPDLVELSKMKVTAEEFILIDLDD